MVITLVVCMLALNTVQIINWIRHDTPVSLRVEKEFETYLRHPAGKTVVFDGPYLFNYLLRSEGVSYAYDERFHREYIQQRAAVVLVPGRSEHLFQGLAADIVQAGGRFESLGRILAIPKVEDATVYGITYADSKRMSQ